MRHRRTSQSAGSASPASGCAGETASLCARAGQTCGACCWGDGLSRGELSARLRRRQRLFARHAASGRLPGPRALLLHELRALRFEVLAAPLLRLPFVGPRLRAKLAAHVVCPYVAFRDAHERQVGCLLHPSRWQGRDIRTRAAFRLLPGFGCGAASYACDGMRRFAAEDAPARRRFDAQTRAFDWYAYSATAPRFGALAAFPPTTAPCEGDRPCP